jgi:ABC-type multidrug transport system fused ATPase/permease subunit
MLADFKTLYRLILPADRKKVLAIVVLMLVTTFFQTAGVASVMPFLSVLTDPSKVQTNELLHKAYLFFGFQSTQAFLYFLGIGAFVTYILGTVLQAATHWVITLFSNMQQFHLSQRLMSEYLRRPYTFFLGRNSGDLSKTVLTETTQAVTGALMPAMRLVSQALLAASIVVLLLAVQPILALSVAAVLGSAYGLIYFSARRWLTRIGKDRVAANRERFTAVAEALGGAKEIRLLGREHDYLARYRVPARRYSRHQASASLFQHLPEYVIEGVAFGGVLVLVLVLMSGAGGVATALPLIGLYGLAGKQMIPAFQKVFGAVAAIRFNMPAVHNVLDDLLNNEPMMRLPLLPPGREVKPLRPVRNLELVKVTYRYPDTEHPVLDGLDLKVPARCTVGLVGSSGAGKSTLIDVLLGLLEPQGGQVLLDDVVLSRSNARNWQAALGYVPQHIFLADQSVAANIALGVPPEQIDRVAVERAARLANLHDFVSTELGEGYDTIVGERGIRLSGGQRQRIGIARALYRDPDVLIFDEATSALDNATEQAVMEAVHRLSGDKTIILVAHRLSTVRPCDHIFVLEKGRVVEQGNWDELMALGRQFAKLAAQAPKASEPVAPAAH